MRAPPESDEGRQSGGPVDAQEDAPESSPGESEADRARPPAQRLPFVLRWRKALVARGGFSPTQRHVAHALALHFDKDGGSCYPSLATLADETGYSERAVGLAVRALVAGGWIDRNAGNGRGNVSIYRAIIPAERANEGRPFPAEADGEKGAPGRKKGRTSTQERANEVRTRKSGGRRKASSGEYEDKTGRDVAGKERGDDGRDDLIPDDAVAADAAPLGDDLGGSMSLRPDRPKKPEPSIPPRPRTLVEALRVHGLRPDDLTAEARRTAEAAIRVDMDGVTAIDAALWETAHDPAAFGATLERILGEWGIVV